jgi:uncharacterized YigZ family protein
LLFENTYKTINTKAESVFKDRGSKFIAIAVPLKTEVEVKLKLDELRKEYYDATHHCYAYRLGFDKSAFRSNDDGEPSGTAGKPIFNQILSKDLTNVLIVVIRYFGGTKLGVSGLINAYKTAARDVLENAEIITKTVYEICQLGFNYEIMNDVMKLIKDEKLEQLSHDYSDACNVIIKIPEANAAKIISKFKALQGLDFKVLRLE